LQQVNQIPPTLQTAVNRENKTANMAYNFQSKTISLSRKALRQKFTPGFSTLFPLHRFERLLTSGILTFDF
jgi:hypothetical protein